MSEKGGDPADNAAQSSTGKDAATDAGSARQLFGHKGGAKAWEPAPSTPALKPQPKEPAGTVSAPETSSAPYPRDATYTPRPPVPSEEQPDAESALGSVLGELDDEGELTKLHPNYKLLMHVGAAILALVLVGGAAVVDLALQDNLGLPTGVVLGPAALIALFIAIRIPLARYNARGYQISRDRLRVVRGIMFRSDTIVPFGRVQHIDVDQGPIERALDIATLTLHTAGSHNSSVHLPGLGHELAVEMRESIRAHIKRETL